MNCQKHIFAYGIKNIEKGDSLNFNVITLGCKVNQYESQVMRESLIAAGYQPSEAKENADITVINTCTVTSVSDSKNRKLIRRIRRENPDGIIVLTGCMPQAFPEDTELFTGCDIVLGNASRKMLVPSIERYLSCKQQIIDITEHKKEGESFEDMSITDFDERTRAFVKIEDGCNRFCSYCIIPYARGRVRSKQLSKLREEIKALADKGYREVVLVGINLCAFGQDTGASLCDAVDIACETEGIERVRLGSIEPEKMDLETINRLAAQKKFCPQFHLSLQSGCDETLKRMNRHYSSKEYMEIVKRLSNAFDNPAFTTDVMVGFAGETAEEFEKSLSFVKSVGFAKVHVFSYSRRRGTAADKMPGQVSPEEKDRRSRIMIEETDKSRLSFLVSQTGRTEPVLIETIRRDGFLEGYTRNYTHVRIKINSGEEEKSRELCGSIVNVNITGHDKDSCTGDLAK